MAKEVIVTANKVRNRKKISRIIRISLLILLVFLIGLYIILEIIYNEGRFTVILDSNRTLESGLAVFESLNHSHGSARKLEATPIRFMDNISYKWIPENVDKEADGSHNGENYIAYTFYVENQGLDTINYHYEVIIDDVIKNVDDAIRIRIYRNGEDTTYAKKSRFGEPEKDTVAFKEIKNSEGTIILEKVPDFKPNDLDRFTVLIWLEGDDPDCVDALIGGEIKMHMVITEEHTEKGRSEI